MGGAPVKCFVHQVPVQFGKEEPQPVRFAFAMADRVPHLLGRVDLLDRLQIDLDASLEETRITAPWLNERERVLWRHFIAVEATIIGKWQQHPLPEPVDEAARRFLNRADQLVAAGAGLMKLHLDFELPLVIRSLFELSVQFEYLMKDPVLRATLYLEYKHVTKFRMMQAWTNLPGEFGNRVRNSSFRKNGEQRNRLEYERVKQTYMMRNDANRVRSHWYAGNLKQLAAKVDRGAEYDAIYGLYSAWAHGDSWTSEMLHAPHGKLWAGVFPYWARLLIRIADAKKIILSGEAYESLVICAKG
ncbi:MAG: hypothetical protein JNG88_15655 [Phycisphaerales bacterium]|nr:hypothetical protein [Phycisphaerales bacterium]